MPKRKTATPWDIDVRIQADESDHAWIELSPRLWPEDSADFPYAEMLAGYRWIAGVIARVAVVLMDEIHASREEHDCAGRWSSQIGPDECSINVTALASLIDPRHMDTLCVGVSVPRASRREWLARVKEVLVEILEAERWQPTANDERQWRGDTAPPQHRPIVAPAAATTREPAK